MIHIKFEIRKISKTELPGFLILVPLWSYLISGLSITYIGKSFEIKIRKTELPGFINFEKWLSYLISVSMITHILVKY
jgi:hypothetical protein